MERWMGADWIEVLGTGQKFFKGRTAAQLLALTEDEVSAGDLARVEDQGGRIVEAQTPGPSSTTWIERQRRVDKFGYANATTDAQMIPWFDTAESTSAGNTGTALPMPYAGRLLAVELETLADPGSTIVGLCKALSATPVKSQTLDPGAGAVVTRFDDFADGAGTLTWAIDENIGISVNPTDAPTWVHGWVEYEIEIPLRDD